MNVDLYISEALKQIIAVGPEGVPPQSPTHFYLLDMMIPKITG